MHLNINRLIADKQQDDEGQEDLASDAAEKPRSSTQVQDTSKSSVSTDNSKDKLLSKTHYNWSPHYSDGDYENQLACPRLQSVYSPYGDSSDES